ncbi:hypothetical protein [Marinicauda sp. Alg238-R41]|uniref:hypothetical protein n=1 Tax=Marinicauda sp. Alg238-R41 TaxID=2993447 RepID=UPI0022E93D87|nr:hypothetical protein [Marinicauda sp. Alg238-R41]
MRKIERIDRHFLIVASTLVGLVLAVWLRLPLRPDMMINVDELIPLAVSQSMTVLGKLDPNWAHADLPEYFRYDQYNFYLYNIISHININIGGYFHVEPITSLRISNVVFQVIAIALVFDGARRYGFSIFANTVLVLSMVVAPTWVHDALMARPESLLYLMTGLAFWISSLSLGLLIRVILVSLVLGAGAAVKVTYPIVGVAGALGIAMLAWPGWKKAALAGLAAPIAVVAGFIASAPYAIANFDIFFNGLVALSTQYGSAHPPHSHPDPWPLTYFFWISRFFLELYWPWLILVVAGLILGNNRERIAIACLVAPFALLVLYFSTKTVFFERNFAHAMPLLFIASALSFGTVCRRLPSQLIGLALVLIVSPGLFWSMQISQAAYYESATRGDFVRSHGLEGFQLLPTSHTLVLAPPPACGEIAVMELDNAYARRYDLLLRDQGFSRVAFYKGPFNDLASSTLQSYLGYSMGFYAKPCEGT